MNLEPVMVDGVHVVPKHLVDAVLYPKAKLEVGERDITCFRVELVGEMNGKACTVKAEMVDWLDEAPGFTSMARTTAFPSASVARMIAVGQLKAVDQPFVSPEKIIAGVDFDYLMAELAAMNIRFAITVEDA